MISGSRCWSQTIQRGMGSVVLSGREVYSFECMRPSLYHLLAETAARTPDAIAVVDDWGRKTSFA